MTSEQEEDLLELIRRWTSLSEFGRENAFTEFKLWIDDANEQQRQMCAAEVTRMETDGKTAFTYEQLRVHILNATGESDDK